MGLFVEASQAGRLQLEALHAAWDERNQASPEQSHAASNHQPAGHQARAVLNPFKGSGAFLHLLTRAPGGKWAGAASLLGPVSRSPSGLASAFTRAINMGAPIMNAMAASSSPAMAKGTNAISAGAFEAWKNLTRTEEFGVAPVAGHNRSEEARVSARQRNNAVRFMLPMLKAA